MNFNRLLVAFALVAGTAFAQQTSQPNKPQFEAVSVKTNNSGTGSSSYNDQPGRYIAKNLSLRALVLDAFELKSYQLVAPSWLDDKRFDVEARIRPGTSDSDIPAMKRAMLEDRFKLTWHKESKELPTYGLALTKNSTVKLKESTSGAKPSNNLSGHGGSYALKSTKTSMAHLCEILTRYLDRPLQDATGLTGDYDFSLAWMTDQAQSTATIGALPTLPVALEEQLGLKLELRKALFDVIVVDGAEKSPSEN